MFCMTPEKIHEEHQMLNFPRPSKCFPNFPISEVSVISLNNARTQHSQAQEWS